jgi:hypothetical protein
VNGWTFAGWAFAAVAFMAFLNKTREHKEELTRLETEREALWEQINAWRPIVEEFADEREERARQAVMN